jgi:hypothetical protein
MEPRTSSPQSTTATVRQRVLDGGERVWRLCDFPAPSATAVAQALSRLCRQGVLRRVSKGVYYRPRPTPFGESRPHPVLRRVANLSFLRGCPQRVY